MPWVTENPACGKRMDEDFPRLLGAVELATGLKWAQRPNMEPNPSSSAGPNRSPQTAAEQVTHAHTLLKSLEEKVGEHPELGQAIHKLEMALAILGVQTGGML